MQRFRDFCRKCEIHAWDHQLERFERLGLFRPLLRVKRPPYKVKIERSADGKTYKELGVLEEGEAWDGELQEHRWAFSFNMGIPRNWWDARCLWSPESVPFQPWSTFQEEGIDSYYSEFQCFHLADLLNWTNETVAVDFLAELSESDIKDYVERSKRRAEKLIATISQRSLIHHEIAVVCQAISNRYYPHTTSDGRTITVTEPLGWDWHKYRREWDARAFCAALGTSPEKILEMDSRVAREIGGIDPMNDWRDLLRFISARKKSQLKGKALFAQTLLAMHKMLAFFYEDITGTKSPEVIEYEAYVQRRYGKQATTDTLSALEYIANEYRLNPRPSLILVVEGDSEAEQIPALVEAIYGTSLSTAGIELVNLKGIDEFAGRKGSDRYGALEKFIDAYHHRQTIVCVLLDNEGRARQTRDRLLRAQSRFSPKRKVTKPEYVQLWDRNYEFDNFTDLEIATALSTLTPEASFTPDEVRLEREAFGKGDGLSRLFLRKARADLSKKDLARELSSCLLAEVPMSTASNQRKITQFIRTIIELAATNHQPISYEAWKENQASGYFGTVGP
jgi:hypothetical protein